MNPMQHKNVANRRDGRAMGPFSRSKRRFRLMRIIRLLSIALCVFPATAFVFCGISNAETKGFVSCKEVVVYKESPLFAGDRTLLGKLSNNTSVSISEESSSEYSVSGGGLDGWVQRHCVTLGTPTRQHASAKPTENTAPARAAKKPADKAASTSTEKTDWADAIKNGTPESYIAFHKKHPNSAKLTVRTGVIKWGHGMHRDPDPPYGYVLDSVTIGDFSVSVSIQEAAILGVIKLRQHDNGSVDVVMEGVNPPLDATVLFKDGKIVACQSN
jgi:hypothetical protein